MGVGELRFLVNTQPATLGILPEEEAIKKKGANLSFAELSDS
jgi:hypothetical protein